MKKRSLILATLLLMGFFIPFSYAETSKADINKADINKESPAIYRTKDESVKGLLEAIGSSMNRPVIISKAASFKKISGEFVISNPQLILGKISNILGLMWYYDGQSIYVYDASEAQSIVITLKSINLSILQNFLTKSNLIDKRYPLRGDDLSGTFYLSGPPIYIELIKSIVSTLDQEPDNIKAQRVIAIHLQHSFTEDRTYQYRDDKITIPGMATVIGHLLNGSELPTPNLVLDSNQANNSIASLDSQNKFKNLISEKPKGQLTINSDPNSNSLLVQGTQEQIMFVQKLVAVLDKPKRHIELSVWIVDIDKNIVDQMGINWGASHSKGSFAANFNGNNPSSTLNGNQFLAAVFALAQKKQANIVSRPLILTQENIPAVFDNSQTYYTKLIGEKTVDLKNITYGTAVSVLPRFTKNNEVELILNIEDGSTLGTSPVDEYSSLPVVHKTNINTVARVPEGKSLLIGGYSKDVVSNNEEKIPLLGDIPLLGRLFRYGQTNNTQTVRMFLIQPKEIKEASDFDTNIFNQGLVNELKQKPLADWVDLYLESELWQQ